jgi:hypothetical protein
VRPGLRVALHALGEEVAADAGQRHGAVGYARAGVVRAAGAEIRRALELGLIAARALALAFEQGKPTVHAGLRRELRDTRAEHAGDGARRELAVLREQHAAVEIALALHARAACVRQREQLVLDLAFQHRAAFLDHQQLFDALGKRAQAFGFERPDQRRLVDGDAKLRRLAVVETQIQQRLAQVLVRLAKGDDA